MKKRTLHIYKAAQGVILPSFDLQCRFNESDQSYNKYTGACYKE